MFKSGTKPLSLQASIATLVAATFNFHYFFSCAQRMVQHSVATIRSIMSQTPPRSLNPSDYEWRCTHTLDPTAYDRRALSSEVLWIARPRNERAIFLYASLSVDSPGEVQDIRKWTSLKCRHIAAPKSLHMSLFPGHHLKW